MEAWRIGSKTVFSDENHTLGLKTRDGVEETSSYTLRAKFTLKELTSLLRRVKPGSAEERKLQRALQITK